jgi:hypothetical protein
MQHQLRLATLDLVCQLKVLSMRALTPCGGSVKYLSFRTTYNTKGTRETPK